MADVEEPNNKKRVTSFSKKHVSSTLPQDFNKAGTLAVPAMRFSLIDSDYLDFTSCESAKFMCLRVARLKATPYNAAGHGNLRVLSRLMLLPNNGGCRRLWE